VAVGLVAQYPLALDFQIAECRVLADLTRTTVRQPYIPHFSKVIYRHFPAV
jgi:hypothetical protein